MVYRDVTCPICKENIGKFHRQATSKEIAEHIFHRHKEAYMEIAEMVEKKNKMKKTIFDKYGVSIGFTNDFYYWKRHRVE